MTSMKFLAKNALGHGEYTQVNGHLPRFWVIAATCRRALHIL